MRFRKLRLVGFKSFVEPTELLIEPGLTGIVGPNGCGKSNLVEALQWAMGEGSARRLRGGEMDDVIFGGTGSRAARNIASVSLLLDLDEDETPAWLMATGKSDGPRLFSDDREVDVERRIDRGKGSNYRVNGRETRARDIQILFADSASGAQSAALVGQGRIGWMIGAKPAERRVLLEEAAGISGLQSRRHEAELKLATTEQNLLRVDDQGASLVAQIEKLKRQARQAERYRKLSDEIRQADAFALLARHADATDRVAKAQVRLEEAQRAVGQAESSLEKISAHKEASAAALRDVQAKADGAKQEAEKLLGRLRALDAEERRVIQQLAENRRRLEELEHDAARETALAIEAAAVLARLESERDRVTAEDVQGANDILRSREAFATAARTLRMVEQQVGEAHAQAAKREAERVALYRRRADLEERHKRLAKQQAEAFVQSEGLERLIVGPDRLEEAKQAATAAEAESTAARDALDAAEAAIRAARIAEAEALIPLRQAEQARLQLTAEIKAIEKLVAADAVNGFTPVLESMSVEKGYEAAIGAAFGEDLLSSVDPNAPSHWVTFAADDEAPMLPRGARPGRDVVKAHGALARRLARLGIVADAAAGERAHPELKPGQSLVSKDGHVWRWDGLVRRASAPTAAATRLMQRNRLAELKEQFNDAVRAFSEAEKRHVATKLDLEAASGAERSARERLRATIPLIAQARSAETSLIQQAQLAESRRREAVERQKRVEADLTEAATHLAEANKEFEALSPAEDDRAQLAEIRLQLDDACNSERAARRNLDLAERDGAQRKARFSVLEGEFTAAAARASGVAAHTEKLNERRARLDEERLQLEPRPASLLNDRKGLSVSAEGASRQATALTEEVKTAETSAREIDVLANQAISALAQSREDRVRAEAGQEQAAEALDAVQDRIWEAFTCTPVILGRRFNVSDTNGVKESPKELETRLEHLKRDREAIGAVNLMAESELSQLSEERDLIERETEDLRAAIQRLRQAIRELNQEGRERLLSAFKIVNGHFQELFVRLFGGGHAELILTGEQDDPLQAGLEIMASPPGKKLQSLSLLSGGERALTALALVFAMFLTNPAPICVLDEVDAPLDDANVERFCALVRLIGERTATRFLIITHHRVTMARMDRLYGVTMMEKGISRLVSVALREAELLRESA